MSKPALSTNAKKRLAELARKFEITAITEAHSVKERFMTVHFRRRTTARKKK